MFENDFTSLFSSASAIGTVVHLIRILVLPPPYCSDFAISGCETRYDDRFGSVRRPIVSVEPSQVISDHIRSKSSQSKMGHAFTCINEAAVADRSCCIQARQGRGEQLRSESPTFTFNSCVNTEIGYASSSHSSALLSFTRSCTCTSSTTYPRSSRRLCLLLQLLLLERSRVRECALVLIDRLGGSREAISG